MGRLLVSPEGGGGGEPGHGEAGPLGVDQTPLLEVKQGSSDLGGARADAPGHGSRTGQDAATLQNVKGIEGGEDDLVGHDSEIRRLLRTRPVFGVQY